MAIADLNRTVFPRRGVEAVGEIEDRSLPDIAMVDDRLPCVTGSDVVRLSPVSRQGTVTYGSGDNSPYRLSGGTEGDAADRFIFNGVTGAVQADIGTAVFTAPDHFAATAWYRCPPVADIVTVDFECGAGAVGVGEFDGPYRPVGGGPGRGVQNMEILSGLVLFLFSFVDAREIVS